MKVFTTSYDDYNTGLGGAGDTSAAALGNAAATAGQK